MTNPTPTDPLIGRTVSQYEVLAKLGGGGMGVVYRARDVKLGRAVALKFLPPQWSHDESAKQRFMREAQAASATNHRNICVIHNIEETDDGRLFIVMACYEGETLKQKLERGPLPIVEAIEIASEIAEGLAKAHGQGVVHRDVKPGNLMITDDGVKILDFGLAKFADALQLTVPGSTIGTVGYMAPEQARGEEADTRSDVWALGIVMYEMLTGSVPFHGAYPEATFHAIKNEPLPSLRAARPETPESLERIVLKALEKDPARRFQSAREPARDLRLLQGRTVPLELRTEELPAIAAVRSETVARKSSARGMLTPMRVAVLGLCVVAAAFGWYLWTTRPIVRLRVAIVPVANHTGSRDLDRYRLALTSTLIDELSESPNIRVIPYLRLVEMIRPFLAQRGDIANNDAIHAIATESGAPFLVVPTLVYRDRDATWLAEVEIRNAETGTSVATYETAPVVSSLSQQTAFRLVTAAADSVQQHFKANGPGRSFRARPTSSRFREPDAARWFAEGLNKYDELEYSAALDAFAEAAKLDAQHALTEAWLGRMFSILNRKNEAAAAGQRAKTLATADSPQSDVAFIDAVLAESQGDPALAERRYRDLLRLEPDDPWAITELADFLKRRQDRNPPAVEAYHDVLRLDPTYIRPHIDLCQLYTRMDDHPFAEKESQIALERFRARGIKGGEAQTLLCLGEAQREQGGTHLADARRNIEAARNLIATLDQPYNLSRVVFYQGLVDYSDGRFREAARFFEDAASRADTVANRVTQGTALMNVAVITQILGQPTRALEFYGRARDVFLRAGDERRAAEADVNLAGLQIDFGRDPEGARRILGNARANVERLGHLDFQLVAMQNAASGDWRAGRILPARTLLGTALEMARDKQLTSRMASLTVTQAQTSMSSGDYNGAISSLQGMVASLSGAELVEARLTLGEALTRAGDLANAKSHLEGALSDARARDLSGVLPRLHTALGKLAYESRQPASVVHSHFDAAVAAWSDPLPEAASVEAGCNQVLKDLDVRPRARRDVESGMAWAQSAGYLHVEARCRLSLAELEMQARNPAGAIAALDGIPEDRDDRLLDPELRAEAQYSRGVALMSQRDAKAGEWFGLAAASIRKLQASLPVPLQRTFEARRTPSLILQTAARSTQP